jgi:hypothetical protein
MSGAGVAVILWPLQACPMKEAAPVGWPPRLRERGKP